MLMRLLLLVLILVGIRFVVRLVRQMLDSTSRRPEVHSRRQGGDDPTRGRRIIDVEFTEDRNPDDAGRGER